MLTACFWRVFVGKTAKTRLKHVGKTAKIGLKHVGKNGKNKVKHVGKVEIYSYFCAVKMEIICLKERLTGIYKIFMPAHERHC